MKARHLTSSDGLLFLSDAVLSSADLVSARLRLRSVADGIAAHERT